MDSYDRPRSANEALRHWLSVGTVLLVVGLGLFLRVALNVAEGHPAGPPAGPMEEHEGVLEVLYEDRTDGSRTLYALETVAERLSLHFAATPPALLSGSKVRVRGARAGQTLALDSSASVQTLAAAVPNSFGEQRTLVMLINFSDNPTQPYTLDYARSIVFDTTSQFDLENSFQQTWLTGDVVGWFTLALSSTTCDYATWSSQAQSAASAAGINLSTYTRYVYAFPQVNACNWWGMGTVGGNPSQAWINGSLQLQVTAHEMGHNFGLYHSHALDCGTTTLGTSCSLIEYGDSIDVMGNSRPGHYNAFQKERLGWLAYGSSPPITTVMASGTYTLDPFEPAGSRPKALKILKSTDATTGARTWYYVEYRQAIGVDNFLTSNANVLNGVVIHTGSESNANTSDLLDLTPATSAWSDPALVVGQSFVDPDASITITVAWATGTDAGVTVTLGSGSCVRANPTVVLSPSLGPSVLAGTTVTYTASVTSNDSAGCASATFSLQPGVPAGWTAALGSSSLTLSPGATASTTLQATSPTSAAAGSYVVAASATNTAAASYVASSSATYLVASCVRATPTVILSPSPGPSVFAGTAVTYTVSVTNNDSASCASASFGLQPSVPAGWMAALASSSLTLSPGATASTTVQVTSASTAVAGSYGIAASATNTGATSYTGSSTATYVIVSATLSITVSTDRASYSRNQTVSIKALVTKGGSAVANASVTFSVTKPNGAVVTGTATTNTAGAATYTVRVARKDPLGVYQVRATVTNGGSTASATTSFTVK